MEKKRKLNYKALIIGLISLVLSCMAFHFSWTDRNIRLNGKTIKAPIVEFYGRISRPNGSCSVMIEGKVLNAGSFDKWNYSVGDSIEVCYIPDEYCVVQKRMNPERYYLFFSLAVLPFVLGIYLILAGLLGSNRKTNSIT